MSSVEPVQSGNVPATQNPLGRPEGLEDFGTEDQVMPYLRINHQQGVFVDSLSSREFPELEAAVLLGLVKQRILWPPDVAAEGDAEPPLCRSYDFQVGWPSRPQELPNGTTYERFPWEASGFQQGAEQLPCSQCALKEWGSHPKRDAPWCSETHTFALLLPQEDGNFVPSLFQIQRSGLKPSRQYLSSFANANQPLFTVFTRIKLEGKKMGNNPFFVPKFENIGPTDQAHFPMFSQMYRGIRDFLTTPRVEDDTESDDTMGSQVEAPVQVQQPAAAPVQAPVQQAPVSQPAPVPQEATVPQAPVAPPQPAPAPAPAPEQPAPVPTAPQPAPAPQTPVEDTQQAAPAPAPAAGIAPPMAPPVAPVAATPAPAPEQPAPAPAAASTDDDEIPF